MYCDPLCLFVGCLVRLLFVSSHPATGCNRWWAGVAGKRRFARLAEIAPFERFF